MKPEKMTDEALENVELVAGVMEDKAAKRWSTRTVERLLANIAALEAEIRERKELGEAVASAAEYVGPVTGLSFAVQAIADERDALRTQVEGLTAERDEWKARAESRHEEIERQVAERQREWQGKQNEAATHRHERDALRERVRASEKEKAERKAGLVTMQDTVRAAVDRAETAESHLAAIRQRAESMPDTPLRQFILDAPVDVVWEGAAHPSPERDPSDAPEVCAEPTTTEAFATVRRVLRGRLAVVLKGAEPQGPDAGEVALSLLEFRMGAMARALRGAVEWMRKDGGAKMGSEPCRHSGACKWQRAEAVLLAAESALTDAPPVFTLEEVERESKTLGQDWVKVGDLLERLTALRR